LAHVWKEDVNDILIIYFTLLISCSLNIISSFAAIASHAVQGVPKYGEQFWVFYFIVVI
jgi:hypothetical protein